METPSSNTVEGHRADTDYTSRQNWCELWRRLGVKAPSPSVYEDTIQHYKEPHRAYHTRQHLNECLRLQASVREQCTQHTTVPATHDAQLLVDIDLAILDASKSRYDQYEKQVRFEYQWVDEVLY